MALVEESAIIAAPIADVFDVIADHRHALRWMEGFSKFDILPGPTEGVGARVRATGMLLGFSVESELEIVAYARPYRLASRSDSPVRSHTAWILSEEDSGTRVRYSGEYQLPFALRIAGERAITHAISMQVQRSLSNLKRILETRAQRQETC